MGVLRFLLASMVLISHLGVGVRGYNVGVMAVIAFYLLAGQVVVRLWGRMRNEPNAMVFFVRDRLLRIFPQYFLAIVLSTSVWFYFSPKSSFLPIDPSGWDWLANLTVIPLNFFMYTGLDSFMLIPPAWSLGAELQFYLLTPVLFSLSSRSLSLVFLASFGVFVLAQFEVLNSDYYGYRLLPGVLFIFLIGSMLSKQSALRPMCKSHWAALFFFLSGVGLYALALLFFRDHQPFRVEVALGLFLGFSLIFLLQRNYNTQPWLKITNRRAGELSYGIFLYHFPVIWTLQSLGRNYTGILEVSLVLFFSILLAAAGHWCVERPLWRYMRPRVII